MICLSHSTYSQTVSSRQLGIALKLTFVCTSFPGQFFVQLFYIYRFLCYRETVKEKALQLQSRPDEGQTWGSKNGCIKCGEPRVIQHNNLTHTSTSPFRVHSNGTDTVHATFKCSDTKNCGIHCTSNSTMQFTACATGARQPPKPRLFYELPPGRVPWMYSAAEEICQSSRTG